MTTKFVKINEVSSGQSASALQQAGEILRRGGLVVFPTETVYGLGGDGTNAESACAIYAAKKAREFGVTVSMDAGGAYPNIEQLLPLVDVLIPSEEFACKVTGCADARDAAGALQQTCHPQTLIVTQGSRGGFLWEDGREVRYPVFPVHTIDSNGAGDTFHGAFLAARLKGMSVYEACRFASAASALKCTRFGAQQGIPSCGEVLDFLKTHDGVIVEA